VAACFGASARPKGANGEAQALCGGINCQATQWSLFNDSQWLSDYYSRGGNVGGSCFQLGNCIQSAVVGLAGAAVLAGVIAAPPLIAAGGGLKATSYAACIAYCTAVGKLLDDLTDPNPKPTSPWSLPPSPRGLAIEEMLGGNLPQNFPTIDRFANGTATSIKSIDLTAASYQGPGGLTSKLTGYVNSVAGFDGDTLGTFAILQGETTARELVVAVQSGVASSAQQAALTGVVQYGASKGVIVRMVSVP
jgi:hypothetical protein